MKRPNCTRCGGPLDLFYEPETNRQEWTCNNPKPIWTDAEFEKIWDNLPGDEVVRLEKEIMLV